MADGLSLRGKRALVVGASRGIGAAIAESYAGAGAALVLAGRDSAALSRQQSALRTIAGIRSETVVMDLTDEGSVEAGVGAAVDALGGLDVVVNAGGISPIYKQAIATTAAEWDAIFDTNVRGAFLLARTVGPRLLAQGSGVLVMISSVHEHVGSERLAAYAASKGAIGLLVRSLALEWARGGVRVNAIAPGYVETDMTMGMRANPRLAEMIMRETPMGRFATPTEIASAALFLASDASSFITGTSLVVDGGWLAR